LFVVRSLRDMMSASVTGTMTAAAELIESLSGSGRKVHAIQGDMGNPDFPSQLFADAVGRVGPPTAIVNNAGITGRIGRFADLPHSVLCRTFDVNVTGAMLMCQCAVRHWEMATIPGRIVNISSVASTLGAPSEYVHYAASKAAIEAFSIGLGKELGSSGIRVNAVAPGTTLTDIHAEGGDPERPQRVASRIPLGRAAHADEIAAAVMWLLSPEASYMTGSVMRVGGGI
jgi:NAD(P)-dependent dehydrogenase (short-subunit alcohol dehydrogenase family)